MSSRVHLWNPDVSRGDLPGIRLFSIFLVFTLLFSISKDAAAQASGSAPNCAQAAATAVHTAVNSLSLAFANQTTAGDVILVGFDFATSATAASVTDSQGNVFTQVGTQLTSPSGARAMVYYAKNIVGGADTVTVNLSANSTFIELYLTEYSGVSLTNPIDAQAGATGSSASVSSGNATTTLAGDLIYGFCVGDQACTEGSGQTARSTFNGNLSEDEPTGNAGTYAATSGWTMQMVALRPLCPQATASHVNGGASSYALALPYTTAAGDLILVGFDFATTTTPTSVTDSQGNNFMQVGTTLISPGNSQSVAYFARNIKGGPDTVTVKLSAASAWIEVYVNEYYGMSQVSPIDTEAGASGSSSTVNSGSATTTQAGDIIYGYCVGDWACTAGPGFTARSTFDGNLTEDEVAINPGVHDATAAATSGWTMQMVALRPTMPTAPAISSATTANGAEGSAFSYQITASNSPASYGASNLPAGLTLNTITGLISGAPTVSGTYIVGLSATNGGGTAAATLTLTFVPTSFYTQATASAIHSAASSFSLALPQNTLAGDLILVGFDFDSTATAVSVTDTQGDIFTEAGAPLTTPGGTRSVVYYARNIKGGADTVTVKLSANSSVIEVYLSEYYGLNSSSPIDAQAGATGSSAAVSSGPVTTSAAGDIIYAYCVGDIACTVGPGFTARSTLDGNLIEDKVAGTAGPYAGAASATSSWAMQMVALRPASPGTGLPVSAPVAILSPASLTFATQAVGSASAAQTATLSNTGTAAMTISSIAPTGTTAGDFNVSSACGPSLPAGANCAISVTFKPTATGVRTAAIAVTDNAPGSPHSVSLAGTGGSGTPTVTVSPASLSFGAVPVATSGSSQAVSLTNTGSVTVTISGITVAGNNATDFAQVNSCNSSVAVGATCTIAVLFTPEASGVRVAALSVADNAAGSPQSVTLSGTGGHDVMLSWTASPTPGIAGYNLYRGTSPAGESSIPLNSTPVAGTTFVDQSVSAGATYYYEVVAVASNDASFSADSNETSATVPTP